MKYIYLFFFILIFTHCGIDKEAVVAPLPSITNSGELDTTFNTNGILALHSSASGNSHDDIFDLAIDSENRVVAVGQSINGSGNYDLVVWRLTVDGSLDPSFNGNGIFIHGNAAGGNSTDVGYAVAIGPNNEIYVTGSSINGASNSDMVVWKISSTGNLDTSFNGTGYFVHNSAAGGNTHDQGSGIALDSTGKIVVTGFSDQTVTNRDLAVWRFNTNGTLDTSFDTDGIATDDGTAGGEDDNGNSLAIDSSDNIFVVGRADSAANSGDMAIWKFTSAGAPDTSFNGTGFFSQNGAAGGSGFDSATDIVLDSSGALYVSGYSKNASSNNDMVVWKLLASGSLDINFNGTGFNTFDTSTVFGGNPNDTGESIAIDAEGKIVITGIGNEDMAMWRYKTDGTLDTGFNTDGFFSHDSAAGGFAVDSGKGLAQDSLLRFYVGGFSENNSGDNDACFWRFK